MNEIKSRYGYIFRLIEELKPKSIIEIGVAKGKTAKWMLDTAPKDTTYTGYDVFDFSDQEFHKMVGNGKRVHTVSQVKQRLKEHASRVELIKGVTQETLWKNPKSADLVFIDG
jgi:predicted O-methyltransferase YrrM